MSPPIFYAEVPGFYAEVERARDPTLANRPVLVGGDPRKRGTVVAASEDALRAGVELGMGVLEALQLCPRARSLRTNMRRYREVASQLRSCLRRTAEALEPAGLGAAYLEAWRSDASPAAVGAHLRAAVARELGLPLRVGIAPVKFLARLAAEEAGPAGVREVEPGEVEAFLHPLPARRLPGVGPRTACRLMELGAVTVGDVAALSGEALESLLGNHGLAILEAARGRGPTRLRPLSHPRSLSQETTLAEPEFDLGILGERLAELAVRLAEALKLESLTARRVAIKVRYRDLETVTRRRTLAHPIASASQVEAVARGLLALTEAGTRPVRLLGVSLASLSATRADEPQLSLFPDS